MVIAIDGPAGAGKSTVARAVADRLGFTYLDTGAMYRCVALAALRGGGDPAALASTVTITVGDRVTLDGEDVSEAIRAPEVAQAASKVAVIATVRRAMVDLQRQTLSSGDWVIEGRDTGSVVAPGAELKVFLTADAHERARRRAAQHGLEVNAVMAEQERRDRRDRTRTASPLTVAPDALTLDTTGLSLEQVVTRLVELANQRRDRAGSEGA
ncbi:MAG: (d)CMP kinase [Solirubrobacteraceae bacterium]